MRVRLLRALVLFAVASLFFVGGWRLARDRDYTTKQGSPMTICRGETLVMFDQAQVNEAKSAYPWKFTSEKSEPFGAEVSLREFSLGSGRWKLEEGECVTLDFATDGARVTVLPASDMVGPVSLLIVIGAVILIVGNIINFGLFY